MKKQNKNKTNTTKDIKEKASSFLKPKYKYSDIPAAAQKYAIILSASCAALIIVFALLALIYRSPQVLIGALVAVLFWGYQICSKIFPFMYGNAVYFDGVIVSQKNRDGVNGIAGKALRETGHYLMVRHGEDIYKITIPKFREEYSAGGTVRVYFRNGELFERNPNFYQLLDPLFIVATKVAIS